MCYRDLFSPYCSYFFVELIFQLGASYAGVEGIALANHFPSWPIAATIATQFCSAYCQRKTEICTNNMHRLDEIIILQYPDQQEDIESVTQ